ncbi:hypothetical protein [Burkholderia sp. TSV86]|uniref:hypothetical protein n=1 Tax=Burkholderia sp. TSV86 TaxID=1385594 RepID=UPI0007570A2F|nr:hypothetical protein [Burkholderia sp. TSV86]KVE33414.1 hypothetical protein WS68_13550 [Burkholderia sp. TSV86]
MIEQLILGVFLVLPLLIVAVLYSDELWQEHQHRQKHSRDEHVAHAHADWRHPWRLLRRH